MINIKNIDKNKIYTDRHLHHSLSRLTNSGNDLLIFGSAMLEALNDNSKPIIKASLAIDNILNSVVGWSALIKLNDKLSLHVFVNQNCRKQGLSKRLIKNIIQDENLDNIYCYPISVHGYNIFSKYLKIENCIDNFNLIETKKTLKKQKNKLI